jgi:hypothetical protein
MGLSHSPRIVTDGLVLCLDAANKRSYPGAGTTWTDLSKQGNNGTLTNGPTFDSANGGSILFDGSNDYVEVQGNYHLLSALTISCWFKLTNSMSAGVNPSSIGRIWGKGTNLEVRFSMDTGRLIGDLGGTATLSSTQNSWLNTVWYNLVVVLDTTTSSVYVQSKLDSTGSRGSISNQTANMQLGRSASGSGSPMSGKISNFSIYNRVLTPDEIRQNYLATKGRYA